MTQRTIEVHSDRDESVGCSIAGIAGCFFLGIIMIIILLCPTTTTTTTIIIIDCMFNCRYLCRSCRKWSYCKSL